MPPRPYILAETNWKAVDRTHYDVAVLPWGATEAHNWHLPYATDVIECDHVAAESARVAWEKGARVIVLPTIPFGVQTGQMDIKLCINMNPSTQAAVLADVVHSLDVQGIRKLVVLNGHGGNNFQQMIRELQPKTRVFLCAVNWWPLGDAKSIFHEPGDHAGELETSFIMHVAPGLVNLDDAGPGAERKPSVRGLREKWAWSPRPWTKVSADTGVGDPRKATAEKGARHLAAVAEQLGEFLHELATTDVERMYE